MVNQPERRQKLTVRERIQVAVPLLTIWGIGTAVMAVIALQPSETASQILLDPTFTLGKQWYTGLVSNFGILAWTVGAVAAVAGAWICRLGGRVNARRFLSGGAMLGIVLLFDDLLQFHAILLPVTLGWSKAAAEVLLGGMVLWWGWRHRKEVRRTHLHLLVATFVGLGISLWVDIMWAPTPDDPATLFEDGAKFLGILAWATYFVVTSRDIGRSVFTQALLSWPDEAYDSVFGEGAFAAGLEQIEMQQAEAFDSAEPDEADQDALR